jgi:PAS domain S-box-containing protein
MKKIRPQQPFMFSFCFICKLHLFLLAFASFFLFHSLTYGNELKQEKRVLILFPAQSDLPAYPAVEKGIKSGLKAGTEFRLEYFIEHMDYYRNADQKYNQLLLDLYHHKFSNHRIDLVIAYSAPSLSLVMAHGNDLFVQTPVVFSGILREQIKGLHLSPLVTGVLLDIDYAGLLETALKIHPQTRHMAIVNGASKTDLLIEKEFRKALEPYTRRFDFIDLTRLPMGKILEKVQDLPENTIILYYLLTQDGEGKGFPPWEAASIVAKAANAPVYGCLDSYFGHGIVGGRMTSMEMTGVKAGEMALRILRGEKPSDIPMTSQGTIINLVDWRQFKRFGIREDRLPPGSIVRFKTYSFWELYRGYIVAALLLILVQSGLISFLLRQRAQRRRTEAKYRTVADFTYDWEYWANVDNSLEYVSPSCERISGYTTRDFMDKPSLFKEIIVPEDRDIWDRHYHDSRRVLKPREIQFRIQRRDGEIRWIEHNCQPVTGHQGRLLGFRASNRDITSRRLAEVDLRGAYTEIEQLKNQLEAETAYLQAEIKLEHNFESIVGNSAALKYVLYKVEQVAAADTTVLVLGETGTGKELIARAIHNNSPRGGRPLVKVNCVTLPSHLIESELFGHERGAFTGAQTRQLGRFEVADGTSIFLDEIGELTPELQTKLMRVLQDEEFERLGSPRTIKVDVRVIAATNRDLEEEVRKGRFREDLFYRLNVYPITVPPLRQRLEDIPLLARFFVERASKRLGKSIEQVPESIVKKLQDYSWPGNVRELENVIERAVLNSSGPKLHLADDLAGPARNQQPPSLKSLQETEKEHIVQVLHSTKWRIDGVKGAALILEMNPSTLRSRMRKLGIQKP